MTKPMELYRLQELDAELKEKRRRLAEVEAQLQGSEAVQEARRALDVATEVQRAASGSQRDLELALESLCEKAAAAEKRLYSGAVTSPRELAELQAETVSLARRRQQLEEELLQAMIEREEADGQASAARSRLQGAEANWSALQTELSAEQDALRKRLAGLKKERQGLVSVIDEDYLASYLSLGDRTGGLAVVRVEDGAFGGCGVALARTREWQLRQGELASCNNCERILVRI